MWTCTNKLPRPGTVLWTRHCVYPATFPWPRLSLNSERKKLKSNLWDYLQYAYCIPRLEWNLGEQLFTQTSEASQYVCFVWVQSWFQQHHNIDFFFNQQQRLYFIIIGSEGWKYIVNIQSYQNKGRRGKLYEFALKWANKFTKNSLLHSNTQTAPCGVWCCFQW